MNIKNEMCTHKYMESSEESRNMENETGKKGKKSGSRVYQELSGAGEIWRRREGAPIRIWQRIYSDGVVALCLRRGVGLDQA
jgi:hypothetical protein